MPGFVFCPSDNSSCRRQGADCFSAKQGNVGQRRAEIFWKAAKRLRHRLRSVWTAVKLELSDRHVFPNVASQRTSHEVARHRLRRPIQYPLPRAQRPVAEYSVADVVAGHVCPGVPIPDPWTNELYHCASSSATGAAG